MENKIKKDEENKEPEKIAPEELGDEALEDISGGSGDIPDFQAYRIVISSPEP